MQIQLQDQSEYVSRSIKVLSDAGVQNGSEISIHFEPTYQQLIYHTIQIRRGNQIINQLKLSKIKTIQQEEDLNNFLYNGNLNAVLFLEDIRKGDIIEYSYTIKGFNPIFKNKYAEVLSTSFSSALYNLYYKILVPAGRKINIQNKNETLKPQISNNGKQMVYEWRKTNLSPIVTQDYTPYWYSAYGEIQISEFNSWKEVNDWALQLFPTKKDFSSNLKAKIAEINTNYTTAEAKAQAAIRFVQDEIRYMGLEIGVNSHKPADPNKVFNQRFGDCKEKSYLLCCMLSAMGIKAEPVLINTTAKKEIFSWLPAATSFNHLTVKITIDNVSYWVDPTIAYQRGPIKNLYYPDYAAGLVISDTTTTLSPIVLKHEGYEHVSELFTVSKMEGAGTLEVTTEFKGYAADEVRENFQNYSIAEQKINYQKFYAAYYETIKIDSLSFKDNDTTGIFTVKEYYTIPDFWTIDKDKIKKFNFSPFVITSNLRSPKDKDRKMPIRLAYPLFITEEVIIDLPSDWPVTENEVSLKSSSCEYNAKFFSSGNRVYLKADYENFKDYVSVAEAPKYFANIKEFDKTEGYELTYKNSGTISSTSNEPSSKSSLTNILVTIFVLALFLGAFVWWTQRK
jgi:transglutaminase-like putative cysteine protease